jgi:hypothetical protein
MEKLCEICESSGKSYRLKCGHKLILCRDCWENCPDLEALCQKCVEEKRDEDESKES